MEEDKSCKTRVSKLMSLDYVPLEDFVTSQCNTDSLFYPIYRSLVAGYSIMVVIASAIVSKDMYGPKILIWFTYWAFYSLTMSLILRCFTAWMYRLFWTNAEGEFYCSYMPVILKVQWVLVNIASTITPIICIIFWVAVFDPKTGPTPISINTHVVSLIVIILDALISRHPVRILHLIHSVIFSVAYAIFTIIYWAEGGTNHLNEPYIYKILDYSGNIKIAILYTLMVPLVAAPLCHCFHYVLCRLRSKMYYLVCKNPVNSAETIDMYAAV